jgi:hypothetical protein
MTAPDPNLVWEQLSVAHGAASDPAHATEFLSISMYRTKVPGGWLLMARVTHGVSVSFYPDPNHAWDGRSMP